MYIYKDEYNTKELRSALHRMEKAIKDINNLGLIPYCGSSSATISIHTLEDWKKGDFTNDNIIADVEDVIVEGGDY